MKCLSKKNVYLVFGLGITGTSVAKFFDNNNYTFYVADDNLEKLKSFTIDNKSFNEERKIYKPSYKNLKEKNINFLVLSPHVHAQHKPHRIVKIAHCLGIEIIPDIDLFYSYLQQYNRAHGTNKKIIAITGTNGKSTTASLTAFLLNQLKQPAAACGNIGVSMFSLKIEKYNWFVIEASSYNLFLLKHAKFYSSVLLGITTDHLEYHGTMKNYVNSKFKAISMAKIKILCIDDKYTQYYKQINTRKKANIKIDKSSNENWKNIICVSNKQILKNGWSWKDDVFYRNGETIYNGIFNNLPGEHNVENILCTIACITKTLNITNKIIISRLFEEIKHFQSLPHRIQLVRTINGIKFINDSKGTNANSTQMALRALKNKEIYLIAGGQRKNDGFLSLEPDDMLSIKCVFLIGEATDSFAEELNILKIKYKKCCNMKNAVSAAFELAKKNTNKLNININKKNENNKNSEKYILLSPLCASFDQYKDFEERGNDFIKIVNSIKKS